MNRARDELLAAAALTEEEHRHVGLGDAIDDLQELDERAARADDGVVAKPGVALAAGAGELALGDVELRLATGERLGEALLGASRLPRRAPEQDLVARVGDGERRERRDRSHPLELAFAEGPAPHPIVEVRDAERFAAREERHGEDASKPKGVRARVEVAELAGGVDRDHRLARGQRPTRERLRERELLVGEVGARQVSRCARDEASVRRAEQQQPPLDAGPEHQRVDDAIQQGAEPLAIAERSHQRFEISGLLGAERRRRRRRAGAAVPTRACGSTIRRARVERGG